MSSLYLGQLPHAGGIGYFETDAYYCVVWERQYDGHHRRNEAYAVSMKMYLGYQNAQMGMFPCGVSIGVFKSPPILGSTMVRRVVGIRTKGTPLMLSVPMR